MSKIKLEKAELFCIHFEGKPLHLVKGKWNDWNPPKKIYYKESAAKTGMKYVPDSIRDSCTIVKYVPETNNN